MDRDELLKLIDDDDLGLLSVKPKASAGPSADERLVSSFEEITEFVRANGREPEPSLTDMHEMKLHNRLKNLRSDTTGKAMSLQQIDEFKLLGETKAIETIEDIFADDDLGLLESNTDIFVLKHVPSKEQPDYIAKRRHCKDFKNFAELFKTCHRELASGVRTLSKFTIKDRQINPGDFFVLKGLLVYVADFGERHETTDDRFNARLRVIFDNGTESDMLLRSLESTLYKDGKKVTTATDQLIKRVNEVNEEDEQAGYIYILRSLSTKEEIAGLKNLFKIGFSTVPVEVRVKNAEKEPTYLMAPVSVLSIYQCYNLNIRKFENLLHTFFGTACLNIDVFDSEGKRHMPREWFLAPLEVITEAVELLRTEDITKFRYDPKLQTIVEREVNAS